MQDQIKYDVAISFAGEDRPIAKQLATQLERCGIHVFFDEFEAVSLLGKSLIKHLHHVYTKQAKFCVPIISVAYTKKDFPRHEIHSALTRAIKERTEYLLPLRLDDTKVEGLNDDIAYLDLRRMDLLDAVSIIAKKVSLRDGDDTQYSGSKISFSVHTVPTRLSASLVAFGNKTLMLAIANARGIYISQDIGITARNIAKGVADDLLGLEFNFNDSYIAFYDACNLYVVNTYTLEIYDVLTAIKKNKHKIMQGLSTCNNKKSFFGAGTDDGKILRKKVDSIKTEILHRQCPAEDISTHNNYHIKKACWSPAGNEFVVFLKKDNSYFKLIVIEIDENKILSVRALIDAKDITVAYDNEYFPLNIVDVLWKPDGTEIGIITGGAGLCGLLSWNIQSGYINTIQDIRDGIGYKWLDNFHILHVGAGAGTYSMSIFDLRDGSEQQIEKVGFLFDPIPSRNGSALFYRADDMTGKNNQENINIYKIQLIYRPVSFPVVTTEYDVTTASWSADNSKLALGIKNELYIANLPSYLG